MLWLLQVVAVADFIVVWSWNVQDFFTWAQRLKTALQVGRLISFHAQYLKGSTVILCSNASLSFWHILKVENVLFMAQLWNISVFYFFCLVKISKVLKLLICDPSCAGILIIVFIVSDICALQWVEGCATTICITFKYRGNCSEWFKAHTQSFPWTGNLICQVSNSKFERYVNSLADSDLFWVSFVHLKRVHFFPAVLLCSPLDFLFKRLLGLCPRLSLDFSWGECFFLFLCNYGVILSWEMILRDWATRTCNWCQVCVLFWGCRTRLFSYINVIKGTRSSNLAPQRKSIFRLLWTANSYTHQCSCLSLDFIFWFGCLWNCPVPFLLLSG